MDWVLLSGIKCFHDLTFRFEGVAAVSGPACVSGVLEVSSLRRLLPTRTPPPPPPVPPIHRNVIDIFIFPVVKLLLSALVIFALLPFSRSHRSVLLGHVDKR